MCLGTQGTNPTNPCQINKDSMDSEKKNHGECYGDGVREANSETDLIPSLQFVANMNSLHSSLHSCFFNRNLNAATIMM